jgi:hypothetical protein
MQAGEMLDTVFYNGIFAARNDDRQDGHTRFPGQVNPARFGLDQVSGFRVRVLRRDGQDLTLINAPQ